MKKPSVKIRDEIARLQEQLKLAEAREAERIGRIALKAGLGVLDIEEAQLQAAFEDVTKRFRGNGAGSSERKGAGEGRPQTSTLTVGAAEGDDGEA